MTTLTSPKYIGFEAEMYWDTARFPVDPQNGMYDLTDLQIQTWLGNATVSEDAISVNILSSQEQIDITPRPRARSYQRTSVLLPHSMSVSFEVFHQTQPGFVRDVINNWTDINVTGLAFLDNMTASEREGLIGNFLVNMNKAEPINGMQRWTVTAVPFDYVTYWIEP